MAKAKKETASLEELVKGALVPREKEPLDIPGNWIWTYINHIAFVTKLAGFEYTKNIAPNLVEDGIPLFKGKNVKNGELVYEFESFIPKDISDSLPRSKVNKKCLLTPYVGAIGNVALFSGDMECHLGSNVGKIEINNSNRLILMEEYLLYFLRSDIGYKELTKEKKATAQESISIEAIRNVCVPMAPLSEQQRIVEVIGSLFEKLDTAKELVQNALDSFESRKAAILHKAFTGELTAKWREENGVSLESWEKKALGDFVDTKYGYTESANYEEVGPKFLRITDIQDNYVDWSTVPYCPISEDNYKKYKLEIDDIVVARTGATTGKSYLVSEDVHSVFASYLIKINILNKDKLLPHYLYQYMQSNLYWSQIMESKKGIAQPGVNANKLKELQFVVPSLEEQQQIVRLLDTLMENEQRAKELCDVIEKIDHMKKAILARAFRGELGTNDPQEESAIELLKEVLRERL